MEWIKCSERLPYPGKNVLLGRNSETVQEVTIGWFNQRGVWQYLDGTEIEDIPVKWKSDFSGSELSYWTHWMSLPEPPTMQPE